MNNCAICGGDLNTGGRCVKCALSHNITHVPINPQIARLEAELTALRREVEVLKRALRNYVASKNEHMGAGYILWIENNYIAQATAEQEAADGKG